MKIYSAVFEMLYMDRHRTMVKLIGASSQLLVANKLKRKQKIIKGLLFNTRVA
jgi:hypothetical protein